MWSTGVCSLSFRYKMHLQVSIVVVFILLTGGLSLICYDCQSAQHCTRTRRCSGKCISTKTVDYFGPHREKADNGQRERARIPIRIKYKHAKCPGTGAQQETVSKGCASSPDCKSWSVGTGCWIREYINKCCDTDHCNADPGSLSQNLNGKRCYTCDEEDCSKTVSCWGNENYCFTAYEPSSHQLVDTKGCASKSACDQEPGEILGFNGNIICCEGNLCNVAQSVTQTFMDNGVKSVTQSLTYNSVKSVNQSFMDNAIKSVTQRFLFLCCSLLSFILLH
ncbi:uncharacterized protein LOC127152087 isoform X1 [Labeo rohita]|uniref:uncharacterized protein LOC127152087 isoform X1 n=1 Tax=Labeo rohita TaxID=84645 RepID=UPI0021E2E7B4|nr:uncharacterized protein LOC127152087 isoform X1 [Labeo rohita]XP_050948462.1 uncharacterized protein LOC127152087 isoform X1 [Labeo rohita]XP_050948463.1 uncharacterized protein LOC127152087 isoform X1 [Labeo rohita]XP_050948464.1 uncharacterized protein LOC127152087 isoform X1 [Labeo rohita]